ncbi:cation:proton antiporter [Streptomyces ziwulingensis]|uniref:Cation:proton antiporter n=1 Tax=Streptomyces ziwulingensis TaxID=1045501 RepID=A0ABP9B516_9ACTN
MDTEQVTAVVIGDIALIVVASWLLGALARRLGQPTVIGQIAAGVALGPTLLGQLPGDPTKTLFPPEVLPYLTVLSQVAVVVFMFLAGYEIDYRQLRHGGRSVLAVAALALLVPAALSTGAVTLLDGAFTAVEPDAGGRTFVMFMAVACSVTALPVLVAIVRERGMTGTPTGTVAATAAGIMDVVAWLVLAAAFAGTGHTAGPPWLLALVLIVLFAAVMFLVVRPLLDRLLRRSQAWLLSPVPIALGLALGSAWVTAGLGLHPVFGAFLAGLVMPRRDEAPDPEVARPMEQTAGLLLPLFFVTTGLKFDIGGLDTDGLVLLALILVIAVAGKLGPAYAACRFTGLGPHHAARVAALVNTRGLTELIVLNVALDTGVIGPGLFTVLVLMALVTTCMTGPLLTLIGRNERPIAEIGRVDRPAGRIQAP